MGLLSFSFVSWGRGVWLSPAVPAGTVCFFDVMSHVLACLLSCLHPSVAVWMLAFPDDFGLASRRG